MGPLDLLLHFAGFAAPAAFLAVVLPWAGRLVLPRSASPVGVQAAWILVAGLAVLAGGLWYFGRDGKMLTYAALVLAAATTQWLCTRAWR
jgi:hypothetical protein